MTVSICYTLTAADLEAGYRFNAYRAWRKPRILIVFAVVEILYAALIFFVGPMALVSFIRAWAISLLAVGAMIAALFVLGIVQRPRLARRHFAQQKALHEPITLTWDETEIHLEQPSGNGRRPWGDYVKWGATPRHLFLFQSDALFNLIPRTALMQDQAAQIMEHLTRAGVPRVGPPARPQAAAPSV